MSVISYLMLFRNILNISLFLPQRECEISLCLCRRITHHKGSIWFVSELLVHLVPLESTWSACVSQNTPKYQTHRKHMEQMMERSKLHFHTWTYLPSTIRHPGVHIPVAGCSCCSWWKYQAWLTWEGVLQVEERG